MKKERLTPDTRVYRAVPTVVRSDGLFRLNLTLASANATNAYAIALINGDIIPLPMMRRLEVAAEILQNLEENVDYLYEQKRLKTMVSRQGKLKKKRRNNG